LLLPFAGLAAVAGGAADCVHVLARVLLDIAVDSTNTA
jgi:uncharacterized membrane protein YtjA (UPF0391 family)